MMMRGDCDLASSFAGMSLRERCSIMLSRVCCAALCCVDSSPGVLCDNSLEWLDAQFALPQQLWLVKQSSETVQPVTTMRELRFRALTSAGMSAREANMFQQSNRTIPYRSQCAVQLFPHESISVSPCIVLPCVYSVDMHLGGRVNSDVRESVAEVRSAQHSITRARALSAPHWLSSTGMCGEMNNTFLRHQKRQSTTTLHRVNSFRCAGHRLRCL
jgi:hypothetical protein